jgi:hypothetical protein
MSKVPSNLELDRRCKQNRLGRGMRARALLQDQLRHGPKSGAQSAFRRFLGSLLAIVRPLRAAMGALRTTISVGHVYCAVT